MKTKTISFRTTEEQALLFNRLQRMYDVNTGQLARAVFMRGMTGMFDYENMKEFVKEADAILTMTGVSYNPNQTDEEIAAEQEKQQRKVKAMIDLLNEKTA